MKPTRIAILANEYPPFIFGGIGTFTQNLSQALARQGVDVVVIAGYPNKTSYASFRQDASTADSVGP